MDLRIINVAVGEVCLSFTNLILSCPISIGGTQLHRGYCFEGTMDDKPADISHLVFVIHGIGQMMETSSIVKSCTV